jgi:predicted PurR-regulated permease PerM
LALIGVIGGLQLFGFIGIFIGPIILAIIMALIKIYEEEKNIEPISEAREE